MLANTTIDGYKIGSDGARTNKLVYWKKVKVGW